MMERTDAHGRWESDDGAIWSLVEPSAAATEAAEQRALDEPHPDELTPATRAELAAATAPADAEQATRVRAALGDLATKKRQLDGLVAQYRAGNNTQKQAMILDRFDDLLEGLADAVDLLAGVIRAAMKDRA